MNRLVAALSVVVFVLTTSAAPAQAPPEPLPLPTPTQAPPEPLPMGVPYVYQAGNLYQTNYVAWPNGWYRPVAYGPAPVYGYPSYYPFGATGPVFGRYSWDYNVYFASGLGYSTPYLPHFPYPIYQPASYYLQYPTHTYHQAWKGFGW
jgi:hypothetical protein